MSEEGSQQHHPTDVFVSYRRTDREFVDSVVQSLEGRSVVVWWDADIEGGADWRGAIVEKIEQSQLMLLVFSEECNHSSELKKELALAGHFKKDVIPVLIEQTEPRGPFLYELAGRNWINIAPTPRRRSNCSPTGSSRRSTARCNALHHYPSRPHLHLSRWRRPSRRRRPPWSGPLHRGPTGPRTRTRLLEPMANPKRKRNLTPSGSTPRRWSSPTSKR